MVSNLEDLEAYIQDNVIFPKQLDNFSLSIKKATKYSTIKIYISQFGNALHGESPEQKRPAEVMKTKVD